MYTDDYAQFGAATTRHYDHDRFGCFKRDVFGPVTAMFPSVTAVPMPES